MVILGPARQDYVCHGWVYVSTGVQCGWRQGRWADGRGMSPSTVNLWLSAVSSFYRYVSTRHMVAIPPRNGGSGGERPLHDRNPAAHPPDGRAENLASSISQERQPVVQ